MEPRKEGFHRPIERKIKNKNEKETGFSPDAKKEVEENKEESVEEILSFLDTKETFDLRRYMKNILFSYYPIPPIPDWEDFQTGFDKAFGARGEGYVFDDGGQEGKDFLIKKVKFIFELIAHKQAVRRIEEDYKEEILSKKTREETNNLFDHLYKQIKTELLKKAVSSISSEVDKN